MWGWVVWRGRLKRGEGKGEAERRPLRMQAFMLSSYGRECRREGGDG